MGEGKCQGDEPLLPSLLLIAFPLPPRWGVCAGTPKLVPEPGLGAYPVADRKPWQLLVPVEAGGAVEVIEPCGDEAGVTVLAASCCRTRPLYFISGDPILLFRFRPVGVEPAEEADEQNEAPLTLQAPLLVFGGLPAV
mmetsp:Transcript_94117/g.167411  ORF Transcript_94117/g.167411 Transcript_94117/m.167411 type:complete len:138 (-) Transcript_94117:232-645(-)